MTSEQDFEFIPRGIKKVSDGKYKVRVMVKGVRKSATFDNLKSAVEALNRFRNERVDA